MIRDEMSFLAAFINITIIKEVKITFYAGDNIRILDGDGWDEIEMKCPLVILSLFPFKGCQSLGEKESGN